MAVSNAFCLSSTFITPFFRLCLFYMIFLWEAMVFCVFTVPLFGHLKGPVPLDGAHCAPVVAVVLKALYFAVSGLFQNFAHCAALPVADFKN